ncbi:hypothetical protein F9B74_04530 [Pelistega sp. NLN82]|uniref:Uncharacterized protein n=1 Tax=Pelistega ratti TaxID=2652177 RepID=A0A6L9Y5Y7_9BURK|nr:hypothetical protein [Pelistega ratti]NEN75595.1 hypothetical protein [Pelistega ratti]
MQGKYIWKLLTANIIQDTYQEWSGLESNNDDFAMEYENFFEIIRKHNIGSHQGYNRTVYYGIFDKDKSTTACAIVEMIHSNPAQNLNHTKLIDLKPSPVYLEKGLLNELGEIYIFALSNVLKEAIVDNKKFIKVYSRNHDFDVILEVVERRLNSSNKIPHIERAYFEGRKWLKIELSLSSHTNSLRKTS